MKLNGKMLLHSTTIKYLGVLLDQHLSWEPQIEKINAQLHRANSLLAKARHYLPSPLLIQLYYGQFFSKMTYGCQVWGQSINESSKTYILQKKAMRIISFSKFQATSNPLFKKFEIIKLPDIIKLSNMTFVHNVLNKHIPHKFQDIVAQYKVSHSYNTSRNTISNYSRPMGSVVANEIGKNKSNATLSEKCAAIWNHYLKVLKGKHLDRAKTNCINEPNWLQNMSVKEMKDIFKEYILSTYE